MNVTSEVVVLFLIVLAGMLARRLGYMTDETIQGMTKLVLNIALPCLTIYNMQREFTGEVLRGFLLSLLLSSAVITLGMLVGRVIFARRERARRTVLTLAAGFPNSGFMGYPIILAMNPDWMIYAVAYNISYNILIWTLGVGLYGEGSSKGAFRKELLNPNIISSVLGFLLFCLRFTWPAMVSETLGLIGGLTTPLSMLLIGTRVYGIRLNNLKDMDFHISALLRLVLLPLAVKLLLLPLHLPTGVASTMFILTAMPVGSNVSMIAELYRGDSVFGARDVAYSTLLSLVSIPLLALLL